MGENSEIIKKVSGWGRTNFSKVSVIKPTDVNELVSIIRNAPSKSLIVRGLGRSYGDAAQLNEGKVIDLSNFNSINLDKSNKVLKAGAGASFEEILKSIIPQGFFLPVSPGTCKITVGGAIASDVHGKNHHVDGSFGNHIKALSIIDSNGFLHKIDKSNIDEKSDIFWKTIGGMGLTGIILDATFSLIPIETSYISVDTSRHENLNSLMDAMISSDNKKRYSVGWIDSLDKHFRGVLTCGDHTKFTDLSNLEKQAPLNYNPKALASAPPFLPVGLLNNFTVSCFNKAWFYKSPYDKKQELQSIEKFFHPLDGVKDWNKIYGPSGFLQYQFVVPDEHRNLIPETLRLLKDIGAPSFLTVLKRFGESNKSPFSFPMPGWTLAVDISANIKDLYKTLDFLDDKVAKAGGRIYLAKDSRQSSKMFKQTYPQFAKEIEEKFIKMKNHKFNSDLFLRLSNSKFN